MESQQGLDRGSESAGDGAATPLPSGESAGPAVVSVRGITKHFGTIQALRGVDLDIFPGEVVGLVGDNGAGKSTLVNIISGGLEPNAGTISVEGKRVRFSSSLEASPRDRDRLPGLGAGAGPERLGEHVPGAGALGEGAAQVVRLARPQGHG